jgi:hypothetical protein
MTRETSMPISLSERSDGHRHATPVIIVCAIAALFAAFVLAMHPHMVEARKKEQALLAETIAAETMAFCERRGFPKDTQQHLACAQDLNGLRATHEKRIYDSVNGSIL